MNSPILRRPPTDKQVRDLIYGLKRAGSVVESELVQRLWDELEGFRSREAVTLQLHNIEGEHG